MGRPTLTLECAWGADATNTSPTWVDESANVREVAISRGRRQNLGEVETGTCTLLLNNRSRRYDPTGSALGTNVRPATPVRVRATWDSVTYPLFYGYIEHIDPGWQPGNVAFARIDCVDGLKRLAAIESPNAGTLPNVQNVGDRLDDLLDLAGWPSGAGWRDVADWSVFLQCWAYDVGENVFSLIRKTVQAEGGLFFVDGAGTFTLQGRFSRTAYSAPTEFGDGGLPYHKFGITYTDRDLINEAAIQPRGDAPSIATSPQEIIDRYSKRAKAYTGAMNLISVEDDAGVLAALIVNQYQFPLVTAHPLVLHGGEDDALWPHMLGREISDRVRIRVTPPNEGDADEVDHRGWIDHIQHMITPERWLTTWEIGPEATGGWLLGVAGRTELGTTTILPI